VKIVECPWNWCATPDVDQVQAPGKTFQ